LLVFKLQAPQPLPDADLASKMNPRESFLSGPELRCVIAVTRHGMQSKLVLFIACTMGFKIIF
jgi:hypothetical protein